MVEPGVGGEGGGVGHPDPEVRRTPGLNFFFRLFGPQFVLKIGGGRLPWIRHCFLTENIMKDPIFSQGSVIVPVRAQYDQTYRDTASK